MEKNDGKMYFPCFNVVKECITDDSMDTSARWFLGVTCFIGMFVIDPVHAVFTAFDLDEGEPMDPDDIARM